MPANNADWKVWASACDEVKLWFHASVRAARTNPRDAALTNAMEHARTVWHLSLQHAYPEGFWENLPSLMSGDMSGLERYLQFLEADPRFYRSGYAKELVIQGIKRLPHTAESRRRLQNVVLSAIEKPWRREFRHYCRLARHVQDAGFVDAVSALTASTNPETVVRAKWVLKACLQHPQR